MEQRFGIAEEDVEQLLYAARVMTCGEPLTAEKQRVIGNLIWAVMLDAKAQGPVVAHSC